MLDCKQHLAVNSLLCNNPFIITIPIAMSPWIMEGKFRRPLDFKAAGNTRLVGTVATLNLMDTEKNDGKLVIR